MDVVFRYRGPAARVELVGETTDWRNGVALARQSDGTFATTLDLPPGVYQHKLVVDGRWEMPEATRTRSENGARNAVVAPGGAPEPWLFAPSSPWLDPRARGGVRVLVGVRKPHPKPTIIVREAGTAWSAIELAPVFEEDEHVFFVGHAAVSAARATFVIEEGTRHFETAWTRPPAIDKPPTWWASSLIYGVFVDRFRPREDRTTWGIDPGAEAAGGDLHGVLRSLDELAELGVDAIYLTPVHVGASVHRYDVVDPHVVDPALGGEEAYAALVAGATSLGIRIIQDVSFAHAGRGFRPYEDVRRLGRASAFAGWFLWRDGVLVHYGKRTDAPLFDLSHRDVEALVLSTVEDWARRGAAGLRLDMTAEVPIALGARIRRRFRERVPDGIVLGELVPRHAWRWRNAGVLDASTDFSFHEAVTRIVSGSVSLADVFAALASSELLRGGDPRSTSVRFTSTHDHPRLASIAARAGTTARLPLVFALLLTLPGIPMLLYGEELGLASQEERDIEDVWPDRMPMRWTHRDESLRAVIRSLARARRASEALRAGSFSLLHADDGLAVFRREAGGEVVDVVLSLSEQEIELEDEDLPRIIPLASVGEVKVEGARVRLPANGVLVMRRERVRSVTALSNLFVRDCELVEGVALVRSRPSRFFLSVTERCNLRCAHCITDAPARTANGTARTMARNVVDALCDDFAFGEYFGFVHGGESLTTPMLFEVLDAIRSARSEPWIGHLLTNGILLTSTLAARLVASGISSLSVSLDGASAATNDAIRVGAQLDDITRRLSEVLAWRAADGIDLRIGLSYVVLAQNLAELRAFVDLGARLGVDWIKLEEGVPATDFARRSLVACTAPGSRTAIDDAVSYGRARGLVMVDHTVERAIWRCRDDEARAFLAADEFANRGVIHPCRTAWETVCIEPNGDARALEFFGPILGNVTTTPLATLWNARAAEAARLAARATRLCGAGPVTCLRPCP